ncbi:chaperone protein dnaJ 13-like, partial [Trifolium medium]|nr:chaperone protein dnaJ 13-like [Trifolium medium]
SSIEMEVGGGRKLSKFSSVRWLYVVGLQGISWRFELHRGGQKLIIPLCSKGLSGLNYALWLLRLAI